MVWFPGPPNALEEIPRQSRTTGPTGPVGPVGFVVGLDGPLGPDCPVGLPVLPVGAVGPVVPVVIVVVDFPLPSRRNATAPPPTSRATMRMAASPRPPPFLGGRPP